jgi:nicotinic acid mononucleotide adenylyltransferase
MCHAAFDGLDDTRVKVSDAERRSWEYHAARNNPEDNNDTFSVGTGALLEYLRIEYQNQPCCFSFCVGADAFLDLMNGKWNEGRRVLDLLENGKRLLVLHRASNDCDASHSTTTDLNSKVDAAGARLIQMGSLGSISSSQVRECQDLKQLSTMIVPSVLEYIKSNKLYQFANS